MRASTVLLLGKIVSDDARSVSPCGGPIDLASLGAGDTAPVVEEPFGFGMGSGWGETQAYRHSFIGNETIHPRSTLPLWGSRPLVRGGWGFLIWFWFLVSIALALRTHCVCIAGALILLVFLPPLFSGLFSYL